MFDCRAKPCHAIWLDYLGVQSLMLSQGVRAFQSSVDPRNFIKDGFCLYWKSMRQIHLRLNFIALLKSGSDPTG
jgi:hypothetical protein